MEKIKHFKILRDADYGFTVGDTIHVNIERVWKEQKSFDKFAKAFAKTHSHELMHVILKNTRPKRLIGEEKIVHKLCNERFDRELQKIYAELYS